MHYLCPYYKYFFAPQILISTSFANTFSMPLLTKLIHFNAEIQKSSLKGSVQQNVNFEAKAVQYYLPKSLT